MCWGMASGVQNTEAWAEHRLKNKLAAAVRSVQWSYAIYWLESPSEPGVLEWREGYYNGEIKTRKTIQPMQLNADQMGLQRSEQLRELYQSLSAGDNQPQAKRPSAALSPEDLTGLEWYYLVCMSFTLSHGQDLPGRALANGHHIWLCNAHLAESKLFSRSLLAKSASIQTVTCFPLMGGVLELGVTELISEDSKLIQHITTTFLEFPNHVGSEQSTSSPQRSEEDLLCREVDREKLNLVYEGQKKSEAGPSAFPLYLQPLNTRDAAQHDLDTVEKMQTSEAKTCSSNSSSNGHGTNQNNNVSYMVDMFNANSQVQSWYVADEEFSNINSSDCISQSFVNAERAGSSDKRNNHLHDFQECNHAKLRSLNIRTSDSHYSRTLATIFRNSYCLMKPYYFSASAGSSFTRWKRGTDNQRLQVGTNMSQKLLKKILFGVAMMHGDGPIKHQDDNCGAVKDYRLDGYRWNHAQLEKRRREKLNEKFLILQKMLPSVSKIDKESILGDTIDYLKELERRVAELEACRESAESEARARARKHHPDIVERTSDNYGQNGTVSGRKALSKRKAADVDEADTELKWLLSKDGLADVTVTIADKEVSVELKCVWREYLLLEIVEAISNLHLDAQSVQSSINDGLLGLTLKSKCKGVAMASAGMIKQALHRVISKF